MFRSVLAHLAALLLDLLTARRQPEGAKDREIAVLRHQLRMRERRRPRPLSWLPWPASTISWHLVPGSARIPPRMVTVARTGPPGAATIAGIDRISGYCGQGCERREGIPYPIGDRCSDSIAQQGDMSSSVSGWGVAQGVNSRSRAAHRGRDGCTPCLRPPWLLAPT